MIVIVYNFKCQGVLTGALAGFSVIFWIGVGQFLTGSFEASRLPMVSSNCTLGDINITETLTTDHSGLIAMQTSPYVFSNHTQIPLDSDSERYVLHFYQTFHQDVCIYILK